MPGLESPVTVQISNLSQLKFSSLGCTGSHAQTVAISIVLGGGPGRMSQEL